MLFAYIIIIAITIAAFAYVNLVRHDKFFGTATAVIVSAANGVALLAGAIAVICKVDIVTAIPALFMALFMFGRAYIDYQTMQDVNDFYARWGRRG